MVCALSVVNHRVVVDPKVVYVYPMDRHTDATTVLSFRVPTPMAEQVRKMAAEAGMKPNKALRLWLAESLSEKEND